MPSLERAIQYMYWACDSDMVGYSQPDRWNIPDSPQDGSWEADCSSLVIKCLQYGGFDTGSASFTGDMSTNLCARGWERLNVDGNPQPGDILLHDVNHVALMLHDGNLGEAYLDENGGIDGGVTGDQGVGWAGDGTEVRTRPYYSFPWLAYLRYTGQTDEQQAATPVIHDDSEETMQFVYQPNDRPYMAYYDGHTIHPLKHPDEIVALDTCYRNCHGRGIPIFKLGDNAAPWATRFEDAVTGEYHFS